MTEDDWHTSPDPAALLSWLEARLRTDQRKLRLFVCAACRLAWPRLRPAVRRLVEAAEDAADQHSSERRGWAANSVFHDALLSLRETLTDVEEEARSLACWAQHGVSRARDCAVAARALCPPATPAGLAELVRELFGDPFRKVRWVGTVLKARVSTWPRQPKDLLLVREWRTWQGGLVVRLARGIYQERAFDRLPYLADALEDAGCAEPAVLEHCRRPQGHVRGCWVVDELLQMA